MDRKKELKQQYKLMKPDMGIFIIRPKEGRKCYIQATGDLRGVMNGTLARLGGGIHPNRELLAEWIAHGSEYFTVEILERLPYDKDESKTDYNEDLALLEMIWEEKLKNQGYELYKKRI
jgi:hypothetical protein